MSTVPVDDLGEEREVDLRSLRDRLVARWWIVLGGLVLGVLLGMVVATGGGKVFEAKTLLYMGQPFSAGQQVTTFATNPRTVTALLKSEAVLEQVSNETGVPVGTLRGAAVAQAVTAAGQAAGIGRAAPLMEIAVKLKRRQDAEDVANAFAQVVVDDTSGFVDEKVRLLDQRIAADEAGLAAAAKYIEAATAQQRFAASSDLPLSDRLLIQANANTSLQFWEARAADLRVDLREAQNLLNVAENVERSQVVEPAVAARTSARSRRNSAVVGGLIGLLLGGLVAAFLPERTRGRRQAEPA